MTKLKIYIDFESISSPFNFDINIKTDFPYAYSIGIFSGKTFKTKTFVFNFTQNHIDDIDQVLRLQILKDVRFLKGDNKFKINALTTEFVCFGIQLEKKILRNVYNGIDISDLSSGSRLSLVKATKKYLGEKKYFPLLKEQILKHLNPSFVQKRNMLHDGAIAAYAGYLLFVYAFNMKDVKWFIDINIRDLIKELVEYSKDDAERMQYIVNDPLDFKTLSKKWDIVINTKSANGSQIIKSNKLLSFISEMDDEMTIKDAKILLKEKIKKLTDKNELLNSPDSLDNIE